MVRKIAIIIVLVTLTSCFTQYHLKKDKNGELIVNKNQYSLNRKMSPDVFNIIDTTSVYKEVTNNESLKKNNLNLLIFHDDGYFEDSSLKYFKKFERSKNSVYYGGRFFVDGDKIFIERFYPSSGSKTRYYVKEISEGQVKNDTIEITIFGNRRTYVRNSYDDVFN